MPGYSLAKDDIAADAARSDEAPAAIRRLVTN